MPRYPTRLQVLAEPSLLAKHLPPAWRSCAKMAGAAALFLAVNATVKADPNAAPAELPAAAVVAPIFEHGDGRGAIGCIVVAPPVFLSEEEALQVISEELAEYGLEFSEKGGEMKDVEVPHRGRAVVRDGQEHKLVYFDLPGSAKPLSVDLRDPAKKIAVEYLSTTDYFLLGGVQDTSTVQDFDFIDIAHLVADKVKQSGEAVHFGILYDPMVRGEPRELGEDLWPGGAKGKTAAEPAVRETPKTRSVRLLRMQVRDFAEWLEAQGVI